MTAALRAVTAAAERAATIAAERASRCPWCDVWTRSAVGLCTCADACGSNSCPARNADDYTPPPVPTFRVAAP